MQLYFPHLGHLMKTLTQMDSQLGYLCPGRVKLVPAFLGLRSCRKGGLVQAVHQFLVGPDALVYLFGRHLPNDIPTVYSYNEILRHLTIEPNSSE